jgi:tyrosine-protein phosphatase YwqE
MESITLIHFDASDAHNVEDRIALCSDSNCLMNKGTAQNVLH